MKHVLFLIIVLSCNCILLSGQNNVPKNPFVPQTQPARIITNKKDTVQNTLCGKSGSLRKTDFAHAIDMLGFEKRLVTRVKLKITYRAPNGKMIDYREVMVDGELLPHTTRQFEIESFDKGKRYYFHKSTGGNKKLEGYPFHIQFSLLRYDIAITQ